MTRPASHGSHRQADQPENRPARDAPARRHERKANHANREEPETGTHGRPANPPRHPAKNERRTDDEELHGHVDVSRAHARLVHVERPVCVRLACSAHVARGLLTNMLMPTDESTKATSTHQKIISTSLHHVEPQDHVRHRSNQGRWSASYVNCLTCLNSTGTAVRQQHVHQPQVQAGERERGSPRRGEAVQRLQEEPGTLYPLVWS